MIKREGSKYKLYTSDGSRVLGTHDSRKNAIKQEQAIQISKHKNKNKNKLGADTMHEFILKSFVNAGRFAEGDKKISDFNPDEIAMGIKVEYEHTNSKVIALKIALDHLAEIPDYYTRLAKMESDAKRELGLE